ncbi:dCTP deaminase [Paenibacillus tundrae]|uniref:dCTP deaminase n=1 Tax=Paenibacillus tundrae TaxID=528187 RepID=A0ABT9WK02_9BACL|nr:dCTP deaminase [Paenibacillus tundrae]MDQ0173374.1 dCTP deaminase [Paenibacillus tundrae]
MILTGKEILRQVKQDNITIEPFNSNHINPNSYNYRIGRKILKVDKNISLGQTSQNTSYETIPEEGYLLEPGQLYLASTHETIGSNRYVTSLIGRSSIGRLGLYLQVSADLGNLGPAHKWTLELVCVQPIKIYPEMVIGQVSFWKPYGEIIEYSGEYSAYNNPQLCLLNTLYKK